MSIPLGHAHNDYEHDFPLYDALSWGFVSVEADIFLYDNDGGNLRVAHDPVLDPTSLATIEELYLDPLATQFRVHGDRGVYADDKSFHLLVDIKTAGESTYGRLHEVLAEYAAAYEGFITTYYKTGDNEWDVVLGAMNITISGNRPRDTMLDQSLRFATYDGRVSDLGRDVSPHFLHLLSDNWNNFFQAYEWDGVGAMPQEVEMAVKEVVDAAHSEGRLIRFWNLPQDNVNLWTPLVAAGVDFINTDRLGPFSDFSEQIRVDAPDGYPILMCKSVPLSHAIWRCILIFGLCGASM
jgi:hypothetical protein